MIVLSPHLDDAVWSASSILEGATVVTICAGVPPEGTPPTTFDRESGFESGRDAMLARRAEDVDAAEYIGYESVHMDCLEFGYGSGLVAETVQEAIARTRGPVVGPVGLHHPDHRVVAKVFRRAVRRWNLDAWAYEEHPYQAFGDVPQLGSRVIECNPARDWKLAAVRLYRSQIRPSTHIEEILQPERFVYLKGSYDLDLR